MKVEEIARQALAQLRHQLRTPLNHIIGYSEILLEDAADDSTEVRSLLTDVHAAARQVLELVQQGLTGATGPVTVRDLDLLRDRMQEPVQAIMRDVGLLVQHGKYSDLMDLLRINSAASQLLSFALGQLPEAVVSEAPLQDDLADDGILSAKVLLVEDDENNRDILCRQLQRVGCTAMTAEDGESALSLIAREEIDVVFLDIIMPGLDGVATLQWIRSRKPSLPVIMMSALDEMDSVRRCLQLGAEDYLLKPFDPILLRSRLGATLDRSRLRHTERQRADALEAALNQLQEVNQDLQQFAYAASHDLQSPIRTVTTMSQLLARRYKGTIDAEADQLIGSITEAMGRLNELVDDLLAYSRLSWRGGDAPTEIPLRTAVDIALANVDEALRSAQAEVVVDSLPLVIGHRTHFVQLFQNFIGNSLKYRTEEPPRIRIWSETGDDECILHVKDNGTGFDPAYARQIFEPFKRLHGYEYPGSGIGLAICARIIKQYGGTIWAYSEPGRGSTFSFSIPSDACRPAEELSAQKTS